MSVCIGYKVEFGKGLSAPSAFILAACFKGGAGGVRIQTHGHYQGYKSYLD